MDNKENNGNDNSNDKDFTVFTARKSLKEIKSTGESKNLILKSPYSDYKDRTSEVWWICKKCGNHFPKSLKAIIADIIPCRVCRKNTPSKAAEEYHQSRRRTLKDLEDLAESKNLVLKSSYEDYENENTELWWECNDCANEINKSVHSIKGVETPCSICREKIVRQRNIETAKKRRKTITDIMKIAESKRLILKSPYDDYENQESILSWICKNCGKLFPKSLVLVARQKVPCPDCRKDFKSEASQKYYDSMKATLREIEDLAKSKNLIFSSPYKDYGNENSELWWKCRTCGNLIKRTRSQIRRALDPCDECRDYGTREMICKWYFEQMYKKEFLKRNLCDIIPSYDGRLQFDGYAIIFLKDYGLRQVSINNEPINNILKGKIVNKKSLITYEIINIGATRNLKRELKTLEKIANDFAKGIILRDEIPVKIEFSFGYLIIGQETKKETKRIKLLEAKIYSVKIVQIFEELLLVFEYNGYQHYYYPNPFHEEFIDWIVYICNDLFKKRFSIENKIVLMEIPYWIDSHMTHPRKIQGYIMEQFKNRTGIDLNQHGIPQFNHRLANVLGNYKKITDFSNKIDYHSSQNEFNCDKTDRNKFSCNIGDGEDIDL